MTPIDSTEVLEGEAAGPGLRTRRGRFLYNGAPVYLIGSGWEGIHRSRGYNGLDREVWRRYMDMLAAIQTAHVRFRLRLNPWAFCYDAEHSPCAPWPFVDGRYDLMQHNDVFWSLVRDIAQAARDRGMLLEFILFDASVLETRLPNNPWSRHPFHAQNGGPIRRMPRPAFYNLAEPMNYALYAESLSPDWPAEKQTQYHQQRYVRHAVETLDGLENVTWEVVSAMEGSDPMRVGFVTHWVEFLRRHDPLERLVSFSGCFPERGDSVFYHLTGIDAVEFQTACAEEGVREDLVSRITALRRYGKPVFNNQSDWPSTHPQAEKWERWSFWEAFVAGGYTSASGGRSFAPRSVHDWLRVFAHFVERTDFMHLAYAPEIVAGCPEGVQAYSALGPAEAVLYLTTAQAVPGGMLVLRLPAGRWSVVWMDPRTGAEQDTGTVMADDQQAVSLQLPAIEEDMVAHCVQIGLSVISRQLSVD